ncbi:SDR family NAD(P)-dependent oxidoreductase [Saccharothrix obliqua]|uniref:SDR family NAD(P)-dependent oxidoreductase n=1 Tax=Saccharothrix obliqua TaxID=2861747 RepID=UPI001C5F2540|nr:SDR family NAD(P)-dependent oxidoreductase [Saccharothrix obliqua]MBW4722356.1 SDR family NAD(P)-dependent oxidoreductase [Saccharothrix obliqua]
MKTVVVSGGTDGIGRGIASALLRRGDTVVVIGRDERKGQAFLDEARRLGAPASFLRADLSLVAENDKVVARVEAEHPVVDVLVLCARHFRSTRAVTPEGFEYNFALLYLSRFLLSHGLADRLTASTRTPVVANVGGPGGDLGEFRWDDYDHVRDYSGVGAMMHAGGLANDMLGAAFAQAHDAIRYLLINPGPTASSFAGEYDAATLGHIEMMKRFGKPVEQAAARVLEHIDHPPAAPLSAFSDSGPISLAHRNFAGEPARRLHELTLRALSR